MNLFNPVGVPIGECFVNWDQDRTRLALPDGNNGISLADWFTWTMTMNCKEVLDRVYALLGIISASERRSIQVDYPVQGGSDAKTNWRLRNTFLKACTTHFMARGLEALHPGFVHQRRLPIPSWVPDWSKAETHIPLLGWPEQKREPTDDDPHRMHQSPLDATPFWREPALPEWWRHVNQYQGPETACLVISDPDPEPVGAENNAVEPRHFLVVMGLVIGYITYHDKNPDVDMYGGKNLKKYRQIRENRDKETVASCSRWETHVHGLEGSAYGEPNAVKEAFWRTLIADRSFDWQEQPDSSWEADFETFMCRNPGYTNLNDRRNACFRYYAPAITRLMTRAFAVTNNGYFGIVPGRAKVGDSIVLLKGGTVPFVIRDAKAPGTDGEYEFVGECYVHGVMNGELLTDNMVKKVKEMWFV
jgi:hypothetical protein